MGSGIDLSEEMFHLIPLVVAASILLHSSTDVVVARRFRGPTLRHLVSSLSLKNRAKNYHEPDTAAAEMLGGDLRVASSLGAGPGWS